ncbi:hypothetical protein ACFQ07_04765, partial [Actinomadura adrarensis]
AAYLRRTRTDLFTSDPAVRDQAVPIHPVGEHEQYAHIVHLSRFGDDKDGWRVQFFNEYTTVTAGH